MPRKIKDKLCSEDDAFDSRTVQSFEWIAVSLFLFVGFVPLYAMWITLDRMQLNNENLLLCSMLGIFMFTVIETFTVILLWGFKKIQLPKEFARWLGGATIGEVAVLLVIIVKKLI